MLTRGMINMRRKLVLMTLVVLVSASFPRTLKGRPVASDADVMDLPEDMVKKLLSNCGPSLLDMHSLRNHGFSIHDGIVTYSAKSELNRDFLSQFMHDKGLQTLPNCQIKHTYFDFSGEDKHRNRYFEYLTSLFGWNAVSRRELADQPINAVPPVLAPSPAPVLAPVPSPNNGVESPTYSLTPGTINDKFPQSASPSAHEIILQPEKHKKSKSSVATAVVLSVLGTSILVVLLCCCWRRCFANNYNRLKDDRPLLNLSMNEFSGSSPMSVGSVHKDNFGSFSIKLGSGLNGSSNGLYNNESSNVPSLPPLAPPPGRKVEPTPQAPPALPAPPAPLPNKPGPPPPPPPKAAPPRPPIPTSKIPRPSPHQSGDASVDAHAPKTKLKPLFWDKVSTNPDKSMVWNEIKSGSFQFSEEMIETLFGYRSDDKGKNDNKKASSSNDPPQYIQLLEPKKSQNLAISLKAMNVKAFEVRDALLEGNELPAELLQTLLRMTPTTDEEQRIRQYSGDTSLLGPGEQFLKAIMDIPYAFKRMDALLFMISLQEEVSSIKESFACIEVASRELRNSRLFLKLLEAVLKLGNRMNDGTFRGGAQAFKLDTLLKLSDVKGTDGKTTLLQFVVQEIIRTEGARAVRLAKENRSTSSLSSNDQRDESFEDSEDHYRNLGLKVVSSLSTELDNVRKAAGMDADALSATAASLGRKLVKIKDLLNTDMKNMEEESGFHQSLKSFVEHAEADISLLLEEEDKVRTLVKSTTDYFHGNSGKDEGLRLFVIVRDFLGMLDKTCKEVRESQKRIVKAKNKDSKTSQPIPEPQQRLFPAIMDRRVDTSSSDDEGSQD